MNSHLQRRREAITVDRQDQCNGDTMSMNSHLQRCRQAMVDA